MNRTRRSAAALAVATSVALTASACSSSSSPPESAATASTAVKPASSVTLEDYYTADPQKAAMEGVYSACADKLGITISSTHVANVALIPKVLQQISSKTLPDVLMIPGVSAQQIAQSGALAPLTDYGIDGSGRPKGIVDVGTYKGTLYGLAPVVNATALFYNVDTLKAAGIQAPKTWDELAAAAAQLTKGDEYGFAFSASADEGGTSQFLPFMWSNGGEAHRHHVERDGPGASVPHRPGECGLRLEERRDMEPGRRGVTIHRREGLDDGERTLADPDPQQES